MRRPLLILASMTAGLLQARTFDPMKDVSVSVSQGALTLVIPPGAHLKVRSFQVRLASEGTLAMGALPPPTATDEAGDPIWRGTVRVALKGRGLADPARLVIMYQPCTEGPEGMCYLPVKRSLAVAVKELD